MKIFLVLTTEIIVSISRTRKLSVLAKVKICSLNNKMYDKKKRSSFPASRFASFIVALLSVLLLEMLEKGKRQKAKKYISSSLTDCSEDGRGKEHRLRVRPVSRSYSSLQRHSIGNGFLRFT